MCASRMVQCQWDPYSSQLWLKTVSWNKCNFRGPCMYVWVVGEAINMANTSKAVYCTSCILEASEKSDHT